MSYLRKLYNPSIFQGHLKKKNYFEGWYFKLVDDHGENALAIIPGISIGKESPDHAFIQILDGVKAKSYYYSFDINEFFAGRKIFEVHIGQNFFSEGYISLDLPVLKGKVYQRNFHPLRSTIFSPGIMGWYSFVPRMECYHGIVSMHHSIDGKLTLEKNEIQFTNGIGYIEKDWGTSFPKCWIWMHSNHFEKEKISIMASLAHIPWMRNYFPGFICAFLMGEEIEIFATYNGSKVYAHIQNQVVYLTFTKGRKKLELEAHPGNGASLRSPIQGLMTGKVNESLQAKIRLKYSESGVLIYEGDGLHAGLEVAGDTDILMA